MVVNDRPMKRVKRNRITADLYDFYSFPVDEQNAAGEPRPFRESVRTFLEQHARQSGPHPSLFPSVVTWQIILRTGGGTAVALDVVEEDVTRSARSVHCNQCRVVGWSGHPVCRKRYHFILRADSCEADGYNKSCEKCGNSLHLSEARCKWCETVVMPDDVEEWVYSQLEDNTQSHLLHGVIHSNGFGHLLRLNGREGGSKLLTGRDIMSFWDRLCSLLSVRKVTVMDVSTKCGTEYRLLHAVVTGHSWYGDWGYEYRTGSSYSHTLDVYRKAIETISNIPLVSFLFRRSRQRTSLQEMIAFYQSISDTELVTLKDLFSSLMKMIHSDSQSPKEKASCTCLCAWTRSDVESVQTSIIKIIASAGRSIWIRRDALKGAMWKTTSLELLDYALKHLGGKCAGDGTVVQIRHNKNLHDFEFSLVPSSQAQPDTFRHLLKDQLRHDLKFLFDALLNPQTMVKTIPQAVREAMVDSVTKVLDCKQFLKDYSLSKKTNLDTAYVCLSCHVELPDHYRAGQVIPPETIVLPPNATILHLRTEASRAFQEVYAMFTRFEAETLLEYGPLDDSMTVKFLVGQSGSVKIKGSCPSKHSLNEFRMERGNEKWVVDCRCGTTDDDGERMLACDTCGVWQHTRCLGIADADGIPNKFFCLKCDDRLRTSDGLESACRVEASGQNQNMPSSLPPE